MITLRRTEERHYNQRHRQAVWLTFFPRDRANPLADGFGAIESLSENRLAPAVEAPQHLHQDVEIITYVREGALAYEDSSDRSGVIYAGEFQRMTAGRTLRRSETNASRTHWTHVFQIWLRSTRPGLTTGYEQKRFSTAERRGVLCVVASPDARQGSLRLHQDVLVCSALLDPGQHVVHELAPGRRAWLHLVRGEVTFGDAVLTAGDGAGVTTERAVSLTAQAPTEILLFDLG